MSSLVFTNATLTQIAAPSSSDDYGATPPAGAQRWSGSVGITVRSDPVIELPGNEALSVVRTTRLELPYDVGRLVQQSDVLTFTFEDQSQVRRVDDIIRAREVGRVRIQLEDT